MNKRRKKRLIVFASAIILLVLLCLSISFFSPAQRVVVRSVFRILGVDARIDFSRLRIAPRRISIDGLRFSMRKSGTSVEFDSLRAEGIGLSEHRVKGLALFGPKIVIAASRKGEAGGSNKKSKKNKKGIPKFRIDSLFVDRASFDAGGFSARDFSYIGSIESRRGAISFAADSIGAFLPGRGRLTRAAGTIAYDGDIALDLSLALMRSKLDLNGSISNFHPIEWQFSGGGDTVDLVEVDSLLGLDALVGKGRVAIDLGGRGDSVSGKVSIDGEIFDIPTGDVQTDLLFANDRLLLSGLRGEVWGAFVDDGEVRLDFSGDEEGIGLGVDAAVRDLDLNSFVKNGGLPSSLSGSASIEGRIENEGVVLSIKNDLGAGAIFGIPFDEASGSLYVSPDSVRFYPGFDVAFGRDFLTLEGTIVFGGEIFIEFGLWAPDVARIASLLGIENVVGGRLRIENGEVLGSVDHPILSLDLSSDSLVTSLFSHSRLTGDATLYDIATSPHGDVYIMSEGSVAGLGYDSLLVNVEVHGNRYYVKPLRIWGDTLSAKGIAEILAGKDSIGIRTEGLELVLLGKPVVLESTFTVSIVGDRIEASPLFASALGGRIAVDKIRSDLDNVSFKAYLHGLKYEELGDLLGSKDIYGSIDGSFFYSTSGDVKGGTGDYSLNIDDFTTGGLEWDEVKAEGSLHGGVLEVEPFVMSRKTERYTITGQADLSDADMPFSAEVRGKGERIGLIPAFVEEVDSVVGPFDLTLSAIGDRDSLFADGRFRFRDGVLGMRDLADPIESLDVRLSLDGDSLSVDSLTGVIGALPIDSKSIWARLKRLFTRKRKEYGRFAIGGSLDLSDPKSPKPDITLHARGLPLNFPENGIFVRLGADLSARADPTMTVDGRVEIDYANIVQLDGGSGGGSGEIPIDLNIVVDMPRNVYINTSLLETEIGGNVNLLTENGQLALYGDVEAIRGKVFFYGQTFKIERGRVDFRTFEGINPAIDVVAVSRVEQVRIVIHITGDIKTPKIELYAEDQNGVRLPYDQRQIASILAFRTGGDIGDSSGIAVGSVIEERLPQVIQSYISREMESVARKTLGVETFEFVPSDESVFDLSQANVTIGKYLTDKLYLRYTRSLSFDKSSEDIINLQYRITDHISIEGKREIGPDAKENYRLDLKFKWEY